jgi:hypothetical protein
MKRDHEDAVHVSGGQIAFEPDSSAADCGAAAPARLLVGGLRIPSTRRGKNGSPNRNRQSAGITRPIESVRPVTRVRAARLGTSSASLGGSPRPHAWPGR